MGNISNTELTKATSKKLSAPLVSLLTCEAEIQYVSLRNINFILQKAPTIFENHVKNFFCKFNDPVYVKLEKIDVLVKVADGNNAEIVLNELKEYSNDIDVDLIRKSVKAIGQIILKVDKASKKAVEILHEIIGNGGQIGLQEAVTVAKDILRKFPNKYETLIKELSSKFMMFQEPESKASIIWIIGEYAEKIEEAEKKVEVFVESFLEEPIRV